MVNREDKFKNLSKQRKLIAIVDKIINTLILITLVPILLYGFYGIWDSQQILSSANSENYATYRPTDNPLSFRELRKINSDVFGWITIFDTHIDYPLLQGYDNSKYVNTDAEGKFSLSGSIFLDYRNQKDFSDFNNVIYGHHMDKNAMFGEIEKYADEKFFKSHLKGEIYFSDQWHRLELFAFMHVDAYDRMMYNISIKGKKEEEFLRYVKAHSKQYINVDKKKIDHIVVLSTCTTDSTNGRHILVGKIAEKLAKSSKGDT